MVGTNSNSRPRAIYVRVARGETGEKGGDKENKGKHREYSFSRCVDFLEPRDRATEPK